MNIQFLEVAREIFGNDFIPLHRPIFEGNERQYLVDCIDSNFVSSVGAKVTEFEEKVAAFTGSKYCLLYTSPSPRDAHESRMPSSA